MVTLWLSTRFSGRWRGKAWGGTWFQCPCPEGFTKICKSRPVFEVFGIGSHHHEVNMFEHINYGWSTSIVHFFWVKSRPTKLKQFAAKCCAWLQQMAHILLSATVCPSLPSMSSNSSAKEATETFGHSFCTHSSPGSCSKECYCATMYVILCKVLYVLWQWFMDQYRCNSFEAIQWMPQIVTRQVDTDYDHYDQGKMMSHSRRFHMKFLFHPAQLASSSLHTKRRLVLLYISKDRVSRPLQIKGLCNVMVVVSLSYLFGGHITAKLKGE